MLANDRLTVARDDRKAPLACSPFRVFKRDDGSAYRGNLKGRLKIIEIGAIYHLEPCLRRIAATHLVEIGHPLVIVPFRS